MKLRSFSSQQRSATATVHKVLGRTSPVVVRDPRRIRESGALVVMSEDEDDREALDVILNVGNPLLLQFPPAHDEPDRWIEQLDQARSRIADRSWWHSRDEEIAWQATERPTDLGGGPALTIQTLYPSETLYPATDLFPAP